MFSKDDSQKNIVKVNPVGSVKEGFDGRSKHTEDETLDLNQISDRLGDKKSAAQASKDNLRTIDPEN